MDKFLLVIKSIDWIFAGIILIGGRYFGSKYFRLSKREALNFLGFATAFGVIWLIIKYYTVGIPKSEIGNLFITYLFTTSFYELLAKQLFEKLDALMFKGKKGEPETVITVKGGEVTDIKEVKPDNGIPKRD